MDHLVEVLLDLQVRDLHRPDRVKRRADGFAGAAIGASQFFLQLPECPQYAGPIEPLPFTVLTKTHGHIITGAAGSAPPDP